MTKSGFDLKRSNKEKNEHIPIEKLNKITNYKTQEMFEETKHYEQENIHLKDYIDKTFEYVSILFDFSKDTLKRLVNSFINRINFKNR